jgi:agmatinase
MAKKARDVLSGVKTLFDMPTCSNIDQLSADIAFLGLPFDYGSRRWCRGGTRWGPAVIRRAQSEYSYTDDGCVEAACGWFNVDTGEEELKGVTMADCGDINILPTESKGNFDRATRTVRRILNRGAFPLVIGGDHTIPFLVVKAFDNYDPLDIVYLDAHLDFEEETEEGVKVFNASAFRRCSELPFVHNITQIGLRAPLPPSSKKAYDAALAYGLKVITANKFRQMGVNEVVNSIPQAKNIYVSFDVDVLDPSVAPATTFQEPGGLSFLEVQQTLIRIPERGRVVGFDVACFCPAYDSSSMTAQTIAALILRFLAAIFPSKR